ncbi:carbohydrate ABC transporter permease [Stackebrandtia nassauensis]|uniref:Binding-protein-dependent transport systems inner membrane component n=1 Tax=Stackebrandtia nassauensis (strain DSM 44728 / CIP 108903 / NRRL B-16338 / NBRC 102104 / LLR-40K-21) TaxID=446470 RepID=D3Q3D9_STANL|nr:sugar ABC transporter permease [Stackebrandtia nassauensis]ADD41980.1 binding-protein-dependent transport systems inner membrane component [Stackebrandtia nassauensis DSM 44728]
MTAMTQSVGNPQPRARRRRRRLGSSGRDAWPFVLPALLPVMLFSVYPLVYGVFLGFTDAEAGLNVETNFNGVDNYIKLGGNELFWSSFKIGLIWAFSVTILQFLASLGLALLLNLDLRLRWLARTLALVPWAMPPVIIAIMWQLMLNPDYGPVNRSLEALGLPGGVNWLGDGSTALAVVIIVGVWAGMPQTTITLLAGLQAVPVELHEAAAIDGANTRRRFWHVTLPAIRPVVVAITTLDLIWNFNSFALVFVLTAGGPGGTTMLPSLFAYNEAFRYGNFGYAAAMGNVMVIVIGAILFFYLRGQMRRRLQ